MRNKICTFFNVGDISVENASVANCRKMEICKKVFGQISDKILRTNFMDTFSLMWPQFVVTTPTTSRDRVFSGIFMPLELEF